MSDRQLLTRRNAIKGIGATVAGGAAVSALSGSAAAQASLDIDINGTTISNDVGDVDYVGVNMNKTLSWKNFDVPVKYIGFKHEITIEDGGDTGWHTLYGEKLSAELPDWSNFGDDERVPQYTTDNPHKGEDGTTGVVKAGIEWEVINDTGEPGTYADYGYDGGGVQDPAMWADRISVAEDGVQKKRVVKWKTTINFYTKNQNGDSMHISQSDGLPQIQGTERFGVTVTNEESTTSGSTSTGDSTAG